MEYLAEISWNAGVLTTDDLVFQGNAEGDFCAYDAETGEKLWSFPLETGIIASPITYEVDGVQYVSILVGWGGVRYLGKIYGTN
jgi:outer membrane protein assembly factor BamB